MNDKEFLKIIKESFYRYLDTGSRSNEKLKILHPAVAKDLQNRLGDSYVVHSLGVGDGKEILMKGRYMAKKVDVGIEKDGEVIAGVALKFIMRNYKQNSSNYFENMFGETSNIRASGKPYYQILILPSKVPYFDNKRKLKKYEVINDRNLVKYITLSNDNIDEFMFVPNKTLIYLIDIPEVSSDVDDFYKYIDYYYKNDDFVITKNNGNYLFGDSVIYNDYNKFIETIISDVKDYN